MESEVETARRISKLSAGDSLPLVSILMCAWNVEAYIGEAVNSVLDQTYKNFELIIVDDGSTDKTKRVIKGFDDSRIKYFYKKHTGLADSRNFALSKCKGDYSIIIDSDDIVSPMLLEREIQIFLAHPDEDIVVFSNLELIDSEGKKTGTIWNYHNYFSHEIIPALFQAGKNIVPEATMMIPKAISENTGEYNTKIKDSDNEYIARLARYVSRFVSTKEPLYSYRRYAGSLSSSNRAKRVESSIAMLKKMLEVFKKAELFPEIESEGLNAQEQEAEFHFRVAENYWKHYRKGLNAGANEKLLEEAVCHLDIALNANPDHCKSKALVSGISTSFPKAYEEQRTSLTMTPNKEHLTEGPLRMLFIADCRSMHTQRYARFFKEQGHDVHIFDISGHTDGLDGINLHFPPLEIARVSNIKFENSFVHNVLELNKLIDAIKPDILHGHYLTCWCWWGAFTGFQPYLITTWGSDIFLETKNDFNRRFAEFCLREAPLVTADSMELLEATAKLKGSRNGISHIPFGIDIELFRPGHDVSKLAKTLGVDGKKVVLSPRQFKRNANIDVIIKAIPMVAAKIPEVTFILKNYLTKGSSSKKYEMYLRNLVKELQIEDKVIFMGNVDFTEMPIIYNLADVMVTLRDTDGSACSMLECMACKTPIVASDIDSMREWIKDGENGRIVDQHDPDAVGGAILDTLIDAGTRKKFVEASYALVHRKADYRNNWLEMEKLSYELKKEFPRQTYAYGLWDSDLPIIRENLKAGWEYIDSQKLDQAKETFLKIFKISHLTLQSYLKALIGLAKIEWKKGNINGSIQIYLGCLRLLRDYELNHYLDVQNFS